MNERPSSPAGVASLLRGTGYLSDEEIDTVLYLTLTLDKPLLVEGPAGSGKTELAKAAATSLGMPLVRLQCYEGVDEAKALYEWNYRKQLLRIQAAGDAGWDELSGDIFTEDFLLERPVMRALRSPERVVLLIDEVDKLDLEAEALLLEVLADAQITIPEMGTVNAASRPLVILTSNNVRDLSEALKRRCLYLYIDHPSAERERDIVLSRVPEIPEALAGDLARVVQDLRDLELKKTPSIAETIDWARTLLALGTEVLDPAVIDRTLSVVLKYESDLTKARRALKLVDTPPARARPF